MDEMEYKPNSHKYKERQKAADNGEKRAEKVVQGKVKLKKKNEVRKFADVFVAEDAHNVKEYLLMEVAIPAIKNTIIDLITNGVTMLFNGETGTRTRKRSGDYVSYRDYSSRDRDRDRRDRRDSGARARFDFDDLVFGSRADADATLEQMDDIIDRYGWATVLDLYESADLGGSAPWTANKYGWTSMRSADVIKVRDGYVIKLPKAMPLD